MYDFFTAPAQSKCGGTPPCNGRGTCSQNNICVCNSGYSGPACESGMPKTDE